MAKEGFYPTGAPVVPAKKIAGKNPVGSVTVVGGMKPPTVPKHIGIMHGLGPVTHEFRQPTVRGAHGYGHVPRQRKGHLRVSGEVNAHQLGTHTKLKP